MPTYSYKRSDGTEFDIMQKMSEPHLTVCPETGLPVQRTYNSAPNVIWWNGSFVKKQRGDKNILAAKKDPLYTTLPHYKEKVAEMREATKQRENVDRITVSG